MEQEVQKKKVGRPPKRIVDYIVVWESGIDNFERVVKERISQGYKFQGGVSFCGMTPEGVVLFAQAMVKEE
jgi:hypothetical protein